MENLLVLVLNHPAPYTGLLQTRTEHFSLGAVEFLLWCAKLANTTTPLHHHCVVLWGIHFLQYAFGQSPYMGDTVLDSVETAPTVSSTTAKSLLPQREGKIATHTNQTDALAMGWRQTTFLTSGTAHQ